MSWTGSSGSTKAHYRVQAEVVATAVLRRLGREGRAAEESHQRQVVPVLLLGAIEAVRLARRVARIAVRIAFSGWNPLATSADDTSAPKRLARRSRSGAVTTR